MLLDQYGNTIGDTGLGMAYNNAYASALAQNQKLYSDILAGYQEGAARSGERQAGIQGLISGIGSDQQQLLANQYAKQQGASTQNLISRGLGNTTVVDAVRRGNTQTYDLAQNNLANQIAQTRAGYLGQADTSQTNQQMQKLNWMNTIQAPYPNAGQYAAIAQQQGQQQAAARNYAQQQQLLQQQRAANQINQTQYDAAILQQQQAYRNYQNQRQASLDYQNQLAMSGGYGGGGTSGGNAVGDSGNYVGGWPDYYDPAMLQEQYDYFSPGYTGGDYYDGYQTQEPPLGDNYYDPAILQAQYDYFSPGYTGYARGGMITNQPTVIVGEGSKKHPEFVIPTDPKHRARAVALWKAAGKKIGVNGMEEGGMVPWNDENPYREPELHLQRGIQGPRQSPEQVTEEERIRRQNEELARQGPWNDEDLYREQLARAEDNAYQTMQLPAQRQPGFQMPMIRNVEPQQLQQILQRQSPRPTQQPQQGYGYVSGEPAYGNVPPAYQFQPQQQSQSQSQQGAQSTAESQPQPVGSFAGLPSDARNADPVLESARLARRTQYLDQSLEREFGKMGRAHRDAIRPYLNLIAQARAHFQRSPSQQTARQFRNAVAELREVMEISGHTDSHETGRIAATLEETVNRYIRTTIGSDR